MYLIEILHSQGMDLIKSGKASGASQDSVKFLFNGHRWKRVPHEAVWRLLRHSAITDLERRRIGLEPLSTDSHEVAERKKVDLKRFFSLLAKVKDVPFFKNILESVYVELVDEDETFESDLLKLTPWLLTEDGWLIDIFGRGARPSTKNDHIIDSVKAKWNVATEDIDESVWKDFILKFSHGDPELAAFLEELIAVYISADLSDKTFAIFYGEGDNGKSRLAAALEYFLGAMAFPGGEQFLTEKTFGDANGHTASLNGLIGARLGMRKEAEMFDRINFVLVKKITGQDAFMLRRLGREAIVFTPFAHLWLTSNPKPRIDNIDNAMISRIIIFPCLAKFIPHLPEGEAYPTGHYPMDRDIERKLTAPRAMNGLLRILVKAGARYHARKDGRGAFIFPPCVIDARKDYVKEQLPYADFFEERCSFSVDQPPHLLDRTWRVGTKQLFQAYSAYCRLNDVRNSANSKTFRERCIACRSKQMQYLRSAGSFWVGVRLAHDEEDISPFTGRPYEPGDTRVRGSGATGSSTGARDGPTFEGIRG
jgi:phage/plasmid-associated DNA primase